MNISSLKLFYIRRLFVNFNFEQSTSFYKKYYKIIAIAYSNKLLNSSIYNNSCLNCYNDTERRYIYTTTSLAGKRGDKKPIIFKPKARFDKVINIWKNMSVLQLAEGVNKTVDELFEVFLYIDGSERYDKPWSVIDDLDVIHKAVKLSGMRCRVQAPVQLKEDTSNKDAIKRPPPLEDELEPRPPVVTIMGHVDHGKTTLLDLLRQSSIVESEFGGITQHIGAFLVTLPNGQMVTFLDTPGHAAFSAMRARGTQVTDLIVLVVAADDGVSPQTKECIELAREASIPIIVAINKIDKFDADIPRTKETLLHAGVQLEEQGGDVQAVEISALKAQNISILLEALVVQAEVQNIRGDPHGFVEATVIESQVDLRRGKIATCVVQRGTLRKGTVLVAGMAFAKVRNLFNDLGKSVDKITPGMPAQVIGWRDLPSAGDLVLEVESERRANEVVFWRKSEKQKIKEEEDYVVIQKKFDEHLKEYREKRQEKLAKGIRFKMRRKGPLEKLFKEDTSPKLSIVLKGDVDGSLEAILDVLETYHSDICPLEILSYGIGAVSINDVQLASDFNGAVYTFNTSILSDAKILAKRLKVPINEHNIIYKLIDDLKEDISSKLPHLPFEEIVGEGTVQQEFMVSEGKKKVPVAGCLCVSGTLKKDFKYRIMRNNKIIYEGHLESMRHLKKEVPSINKNVECGLRFEDPNFKFAPGDTIICYRVVEKPQFTDWNPPGF